MSQRRTDANRHNSLFSTGPRTEGGKRRSRGNALRHGLTAETVVAGIEDAAEYRAFEKSIIADYDPQSVVERELTRRLASLLWRLRRAGLIETGLLRNECEQSRVNVDDLNLGQELGARVSASLIYWLVAAMVTSSCENPNEIVPITGLMGAGQHPSGATQTSKRERDNNQRTMTLGFLRLINRSGEPLERINRYEATLWRQFMQVLISLDQAKVHPLAASRGRFTRYRPQW